MIYYLRQVERAVRIFPLSQMQDVEFESPELKEHIMLSLHSCVTAHSSPSCKPIVDMFNIHFHEKCTLIIKKKQEAFRERRHLHVCDLSPWVVTLTLSQGQTGLCHMMSLIVLYLGTKYDVCECKSLRHMTISSFFVTFDLRLWPSSSVKVTSILSLDGRYVVVYWFQVRSL